VPFGTFITWKVNMEIEHSRHHAHVSLNFYVFKNINGANGKMRGKKNLQ
jgi:hypothetical protein